MSQIQSLLVELREWLDGKIFQAAIQLMETALNPFVKETMRQTYPTDKNGKYKKFWENFRKEQEERVAKMKAKEEQVRHADEDVQSKLQDKRKAYASVAKFLCILCGNNTPTVQDIKRVIKECNSDENLLLADNLHYPTEPLGEKNGKNIIGHLYECYNECHRKWGRANGKKTSEKFRLDRLKDEIKQAERKARDEGPQPMWICACHKAFPSKSSMRDFITMDAKFDLYTLVAIIFHHLKKVFAPIKNINVFKARGFLRKLMFTSETRTRRSHGLDLMALSENDIQGALGAMDATLRHCLNIASAEHHKKVILRM